MPTRLRTALITAALTAGMLGTAPTAAATPAGDTAPGTVTDARPLAADKWLTGTADASLLTYWSVGPHDRPMQSTGVVYLPEGTAPADGWPVISYAHGTTGIADHCAPSVTGASDRFARNLEHWLSQGYAVATTDYVGLGTPGVHPYLDGRSAAHSVIDMVRAARAVEPSLSDSWVAMGQSQGGQATIFAAHHATRYAPELDYRGAVATAAPSNIENLVFLGGPEFPDLPLSGTTAYIASILTGVRAHYPDVDVDSYLSPLGRSILDDLEHNLCYGDVNAQYGDATIGQLFSRPVDGALVDAARAVLTVPTAGFDRPLFVAQGLEDIDVPLPLTLKLIADMRANGVDVDFRTYRAAHTGTPFAAEEDITAFVADLFR